MQVPELTDDAVVELAREGGVAFIPKLSGQRTIALSSLVVLVFCFPNSP